MTAGQASLTKKLGWTFLILCCYRIGVHVPVPGVNASALASFFESMSGTLFSLFDMFSGGGLSNVSVFALGVMPYISASIIMQLLQVVSPDVKRMAREEGQAGRRKITQYTRYMTVLITLVQGLGIAVGLENMTSPAGMPVVLTPGWHFRLVTMITFTAGSVLVMWLGEQITEFGVGNGISIILFTGIVSRIPHMIMSLVTGVKNWAANLDMTNWTEQQINSTIVMNPGIVALLVVGMLLLIIFIVFITNSERKVPVQYAKRVVGRKMYGGQSTHIPIKVNLSGVLPIIFAQSIAMIPATIGMFVPSSQQEGSAWHTFLSVFNSTSALYAVIYFLLIIMFSYFYATIQFNPVEVANNLKKNGGFIPGFRPGRPTAEFLAKVLSRLTFFGAIYLGIVAILPIITENITGIQNMSIGGTSVIIVVGVALETVKMLEAQMLMRHYKGFLE